MKKFGNKFKVQIDKSIKGVVGWSSPSNIALVKYWGKFEGQIPANPSISFTLDNCLTETEIEFSPKEDSGISLNFSFENEQNDPFKQKIEKYLAVITGDLPFLNHFHFNIKSKNSFPHSSGIASSASSMSALALCLMSIFNRVSGQTLNEQEYFKYASMLARLGSGSACRSVYAGFTLWGQSEFVQGSSDEYGVKLTDNRVHKVFRNMHDDVLIVETGVKEISSSEGHRLMNGHPLAEKRFDVARKNIGMILKYIESGDFEKFGELIEQEALMLHAMMMTSSPNFILMKSNTLSIIEAVRAWRAASKTQLYFTLDAGANVHLIYPDEYQEVIHSFIQNNLLVYCENRRYICNRIGNGPVELKR